jgi:pimeloyl-ACP methyl ester carboxylesterase
MTTVFELDGIRGEVSGSGKPIMLLHGLGSSRHTWDLLMPFIPSTFATIRLDLPGHGSSRERLPSDDLSSLRAHLLDIIDYLELESPVVVGHSWGASLAIDLAVHAPAHVSKLVLVDGGYMDFRHVPDMTWERLRRDLAPPRINMDTEEFTTALRRDIGAHWRPEFGDIFTAHMSETKGRITPRLPYDDHLAYLRGMWEHDLLALYPRLAPPTLLVVASAPGPGNIDWEALRLRTLADMQRLIPRLRIVHMHDTLHDIPMHRPAELARTMLEFIGSS